MVFTSDRLVKPGKGQLDVWRINIETKALRRLTRTVSLTTGVAWSPDGKYIAYRDDSSGHTTIHLMRADGSERRELINNGAWAAQPKWHTGSDVLPIEPSDLQIQQWGRIRTP
jgi:TolB protein